jgi:hypothetical protein
MNGGMRMREGEKENENIYTIKILQLNRRSKSFSFRMEELLKAEQERIDAELKNEDNAAREQTKEYQRGNFLFSHSFIQTTPTHSLTLSQSYSLILNFILFLSRALSHFMFLTNIFLFSNLSHFLISYIYLILF